MSKRYPSWVRWALRAAFAAAVLVWWHVYTARADSVFLAGPLEVVAAAVEMVANGELARYSVPTIVVLTTGLAAGIVVGIPAGLAIGRWQRLYWLTEAPINLFYTTPLIALIPVLLVILGFGTPTKIAIVFLFAVFPVLINTAAGVRAVDRDLLELSRAYGASEPAVWRDILLPGALPFVLTGVRLSLGRALIGAVVAEFYAGVNGIGYLIIYHSNRLDTARALVPVVLLIAVGVCSGVMLGWLQRRMTPWRPQV